jgi:AraC family transcriptional regulator, regulatory protein of adaptative response / methylated-DNA-[protein]-cysteine methyltransferase
MQPTHNNYLRLVDGSTWDLSVLSASYGPEGARAHLVYSVASWELGTILLGATPHGVCWLGIHGSAAYLESEIRKDFPKAEIAYDDHAMRDVTARVIGLITNAPSSFEIAVDIRATPFQLAVWRELCAITPGATRSYGEIARRLGRPSAARAVGHANGSNPLAILIPCHRAVGADGKLTGYRWGLEYKRKLLEQERRLYGLN